MKAEDKCHIYSYSYEFEHFLHLNSSFSGGIFHNVRYYDQRQKDKEYSSKFIALPHLLFLYVQTTHADYAAQFLFKCFNFTKLKSLDIPQPLVRSENFLQYFLSYKYYFCYELFKQIIELICKSYIYICMMLINYNKIILQHGRVWT